MFPKNLTVFRFGTPPLPAADMEAALAKHVARDPGAQELATGGFVTPYGGEDTRMVIGRGQVLGFTYQLRARDISEKAVKQAVADRARQIEKDEGRKPGARERRDIRDQVWNQLLPHALILRSDTRGWIDFRKGRVIIETRTRVKAEHVLSQLREAFGSFPAVPLAPEEKPAILMTYWLASGKLPARLALGEECELRESGTSKGAVVRCKRQDLDTDEVREHLRSGKQCVATGLVFDDRLLLVLDEDLVVRTLRPTDVTLDAAASANAENPDEERESLFTLAVLEVDQLLDYLDTTFRIPRPEVRPHA